MSGYGHEARLPVAASALLQSLWRQLSSRERDAVSRDELRVVASAVSAQARGAAMLPEHLVVAVKESWREHMATRSAGDRYERNGVLTELVSLCISEFYDGGATAPVNLTSDRSRLDRPFEAVGNRAHRANE